MPKQPPESARLSSLRRKAEAQLRITRAEVAALPIEGVQRMIQELQVHQIELEIQNEELRRAQVELQASRDRYLELYDAAPVGYLTLNSKGRVLEANLTACALLGITRKHLLGTSLAQSVLMQDQPTYLHHLRELFRTQRRQGCELSLAGQEPVVVRFESVLVPDEAEQLTRVRSVLLDITAQKRAEALAQAQEYQQGLAKQQRIAEREHMAHDLHDGVLQSLYAIGLNLAYDQSALSDAPGNVSENLRYCINELNRVIGEVRAFIEGLEREHPLKDAQSMDFPDALRTIATMLSQLHGQQVQVSIDPGVATNISYAQTSEILCLFKEALSNSFRHARATVVQASLRRLTDRIRLTVQDNGTGLSREEATGRGQGLVSMKARADRLGGTLAVKSRAPHGTSVIFDLPKKNRTKDLSLTPRP